MQDDTLDTGVQPTGLPPRPVLEEHAFSSALFGFKRREVLDYVQQMSDSGTAYMDALDTALEQLRAQLADAAARTQELEQTVATQAGALTAAQQADSELRARQEKVQQEFSACREKLFGREQRCVQLQKECAALRAQNEELAKAAQDARQQAALQEQRLARAQEQAAAEREAARRDAAAREAQLQAEGRKALEDQRRDAASRLQALDTDARALLTGLGMKADAEQARLAHGVEQVDAQLADLRREMEHVQQQIWAAHAMIRQATQEMNDLLAASGGPAPTHAAPPPPPPVQAPPPASFAPAASDAVPPPPVHTPQEPSLVQAAPPPQEPPPVHTPQEPSLAQAAPPPPQEPQPVRPVQEPQPVRPARRAVRVQTPRPPVHTVRGTRETLSDHLLDALGRLWDKR